MILCAFIFLAFGATGSSQQHDASPVVTTKSGQVQGNHLRISPDHEVYEFTGIPFAEPPLGDLRFRKPVAITPWDGVLDATLLPNICPQMDLLGSMANFTGAKRIATRGAQSEDCLYLNIWAPKYAVDTVLETPNAEEEFQLLPVYVFIPGGGFSSGGISVATYNGSQLAAQHNMVVATIQYRVGSLGFAYYGNEEVPGNMGLWDQLEAMKWLCENVAAFAGDCDETTLAGQSTGAASVTMHLLSPYSRQFFKRAVVESATALTPVVIHPLEDAKMVTDLMFAEIASKHCNETGEFDVVSSINDKVNCLRSVDASLFPDADAAAYAAGFPLAFVPIVDGDFLPRDPMKMLEEGDFYRVPLLIGANKDEGAVSILNPQITAMLSSPGDSLEPNLSGLTITDYDILIRSAYDSSFGSRQPVDETVLEAMRLHYWSPASYDGNPAGTAVLRAIQAFGDYNFLCPTYSWAQIHSRFQPNVYAYHFTHRSAATTWPRWMGSLHGDEMEFIFGEPIADYARGFGYSETDKKLNRVMTSYWANFIKNGDPNIAYGGDYEDADHPKLLPWPKYSSPRESNCSTKTLEFNADAYFSGKNIICGLKARDCQFWNTFYPQLASKVTGSSSCKKGEVF